MTWLNLFKRSPRPSVPTGSPDGLRTCHFHDGCHSSQYGGPHCDCLRLRLADFSQPRFIVATKSEAAA